jgi:excisionase family DNA binding protein
MEITMATAMPPATASQKADVATDLNEVERLETPKQVAARVGISERQVRHLVQTGQIEHVMIGCRVHIPIGAFKRFVEAKKVRPWQGEMRDQDYVTSQSANASTSLGRNVAAAASARLVRQTANVLKSSSRNGCSGEDAEQAHVIPLRSS